MAPGRQSKLILMMLVMSSAVSEPCSVPYVSTKRERGFATPMAYDNWTKQRLQRPASTRDLATQRAAYAAERSTLVGSLPEKAPPPCAPQPPYVSMMILRPVRPASPCGPPMMNLPDGLMYMWVKSPYRDMAGCPFFSLMSDRVFFTTFSTICLFISSMLGASISGPVYPAHSLDRLAFEGSACCVEATTVWNFRGSTEPSAFCKYSIVTCVLPSGRNHHSSPLLRTSVSVLPSFVATEWVKGMQSSVSSVA